MAKQRGGKPNTVNIRGKRYKPASAEKSAVDADKVMRGVRSVYNRSDAVTLESVAARINEKTEDVEPVMRGLVASGILRQV